MSSQPPPIDNDRFQFYIQYQLRLVRKDMLLRDDDSEKKALINILDNCQYVEGNTLRLVIKEIFDKSVQKFTYHASETADEVPVYGDKNKATEKSTESMNEDNELPYSDTIYEEFVAKKKNSSP